MRKEALGIICALAVVLFIASCMPVAKYYVCADGKQVVDATQCPTVYPPQGEENVPPTTTPTGAETPPETPTGEVIPESVLNTFINTSKVTTLKYFYFESPDNNLADVYYASRDKMKRNLTSKTRFTAADLYDTVYLDLKAKTAVGYCERQTKEVCPDKNKMYAADFNKYYIKTPFDWIAEMKWANTTTRSKQIENQFPALEVNFEINSQIGSLFMYSNKGIPLEIMFNGKTYAYRSLEIDVVGMDYFAHKVVS